jgi:hypothetical protein
MYPTRHSPQNRLVPARRKNARFRGDKTVDNGDNRAALWFHAIVFNRPGGKLAVTVSRALTLVITATAACVALAPSRAPAQWWRSAPVDFEACADIAEKAPTKEDKASRLAECNAKYAGRRKPGGGYSYFDFMQNRHFDIAGPNPTPEEQKKIDEQYIVYLDQERRSTIAAAFTARQQQLQQASLKTETEKVPVPRESPARQAAATGELRSGDLRSGDLRSRTRNTNCAKGSFSCEWPRLSEGIKDIKKLFGSSSGRDKRS